MRWTALTIVLICAGCTATFTVTPIAKTQHHYRHYASSSKHQRTTSASKLITVDPDWLEQYRKMEGAVKYKIPGDEKIKTEDGKIQVPQSVIDHFNDLSRVEATPKP